jgi:hypothetical protein
MQRRVVTLKWTDVSGVRTASIHSPDDGGSTALLLNPVPLAAVYSENQTKLIHSLCEGNSKLLNITLCCSIPYFNYQIDLKRKVFALQRIKETEEFKVKVLSVKAIHFLN